MQILYYRMPVLGLIYLRYAFTRFKYVEAEILKDLLRLFNNDALTEIKDDVIGRIYEYFLNKFAKISPVMTAFSLHLNL